MNPYEFLVSAYDTERLKTLSIWSEFSDLELAFRPGPSARTPREHMVHQCVSEDTWMKSMLGIDIARPALPSAEDRLSFIRHYAESSAGRVTALGVRRPDWWEAPIAFFGATRSRSWVFLRRLTHSAHHRGQLTIYLRLLGKPLYSTYGPTADTGGLAASGAATMYRYESIDDLIGAEAGGGRWPPLPGPSGAPTERP
jgi:uncharacterized damage-inducible protein DinB